MKVLVPAKLERKNAKLERKYPDKMRRVRRAIGRLRVDPFDPALATKKYSKDGGDIWQSYVEHGTPGAWRVWWTWGDDPDTIVIVGYGPHP